MLRRLAWLRWVPLILAAVILFLIPVFFALAGSTAGIAAPPAAGDANGVAMPTAQAIAESTDIPVDAAAAYLSAAAAYQMDWAILAGVGWRECSHGQSQADGCNREKTSGCRYNDSSQDGHPCTARDGEQGPMQFMASTWRSGTARFDRDRVAPPAAEGQGYATDGSGDGQADPFNWLDAAHASARYLVSLGVNEDAVRALNRYNGISQGSELTSYSRAVTDHANEYRTAVPVPGRAVAGCPSGMQPRGGTQAYPSNSDEERRDAMDTAATKQVRDAVLGCFGRGTHFSCYDARDGESYEHPRGRACDFGITPIGSRRAAGADLAFGDSLAQWLVANAETYHVIQVIWNGRMWMNGNWQNLGCNPNCPITDGHHDHVHVSVATMPGDPPHAQCNGRPRCNP